MTVTPEPRSHDSEYWVDEVQIAVELPMGPAGPEGPTPTFAIRNVYAAPVGTDPNVVITQDDRGEWIFDFLVPIGSTGPSGPPGPPINIRGTLPGAGSLPPTAPVGDGYLIGTSVWVFGSGGWVEFPNFVGQPGPPTYAHVSDTDPPEDPAVGQIWFRPTAMGYVPNALRVDNGLQFDAGGGHMWGDGSGALVFGVGPLGGINSQIEQARLTATALSVRALEIQGVSAVRLMGDEIVIGESARTVRVPGTLSVSGPPQADEDVATRGYVSRRLATYDDVLNA